MSQPTPTEPTAQRLECGRDPLDVVDRWRAGTSDDHERTCPFCRAEIDRAGLSSGAAGDLAELEQAVVVPPTLLPTVMRNVWNELRRATDIPLPAVGGTVGVTDRAVVSVLQAVLDELEELHVHTCTAHISTADAEPQPSRPQVDLRVEVTAAAAFHSDVTAVADLVRTLTVDTLERQFRLRADVIDIDIVDVFVPGETA